MSIEPWAAKKKPPKVVMKLPKRIPGLVRNRYFLNMTISLDHHIVVKVIHNPHRTD